MAKKVNDSVIIIKLDDILAECDAVGTIFNNVESRSHRVLVSTLVFSFAEGNVTPVAYLMGRLGAAANRVAIGKWLNNHGVVVGFSKAKKEWTAKLNKDKHAEIRAEYEADPAAMVAKLLANSYLKQDEAKDRDFEGLSVPSKIAALLKQVERIKADPVKANHPGNDFTGLAQLQMIAKPSKPTSGRVEGEFASLN